MKRLSNSTGTVPRYLGIILQNYYYDFIWGAPASLSSPFLFLTIFSP
jgi:hypothetical protein